MRKRKSFKWIAGLLSAAILFTSEGMSCLAFSVPVEDMIDSENLQSSDETIGSEENPEDNEIPSNDENPIPSDNNDGNTEDTDPENSDEANLENPEEQEQEEGMNPEIPEDQEQEEGMNPEVPENQEIDNPDEELIPETVSNNTMTLSSLPVAVEPVEVKDFDIVDEGGLLVSGKSSDGSTVEPQMIYIRQGDSRTLSVRLVDPDPADIDLDEIAEVIWTSDNEKIAVNPKEGVNGKAVVTVSETATSQEKAVITAKIGEVSRTCKVTFLPKVTGAAIVYADGTPIPAEGITIKPGEQKKIGVKITPEDAVANRFSISGWQVRNEQGRNDSTLAIDKSNYILKVNEKELKRIQTFPHKVTLKITISADTYRGTAECTVVIAASDEDAGLRCGDILVTGSGLGSYQPTEGKTNEWDANIDPTSNIKLIYKGTETEYSIYYRNDKRGITFDDNGRISASRYYSSSNAEYKALPIRPAWPLQFVLAIGPRNSETYSPIYTVHFTGKKSEFTLSPTSINTVPGGVDQELAVAKLPDDFSLENVIWSSGDERIVKIKEKTENGVMLQFGQIVGSTQITATAQNHKGQDCYAVCTVKLSLKLPAPVFNSVSGSEQSEEVKTQDEEGNPDTETNYYWLIDKGGKVTISLRSGSKGDIYYTTNGSDPVTNGLLYQGPITINAKTKLKACAKQEGYEDSEVAESEFRIGNPKLSLSPANLTLKANEKKTITVKLPDGTTPNMISWESSDYTIATAETESNSNDDSDVIKYTHTITAGAESGRCTITAVATDYAGREQTASCVVNVAGDLQITPELTVTEGAESDKIMLTKIPRGYTPAEVAWSVDDSSRGTLNNVAGDLKAKTITAALLSSTAAPQTLTVTASLAMGDETISARCLVTVMPKQYIVSFFGWKDKLIREVPVFRGQSATPPTDDEMNAAAPKGYSFDGWKNMDEWKNVNNNVAVYAKTYVPKTYTITYQTGSDGTINGADNPTSYTVESPTFSLKDAVPNDTNAKKFAGWYLEEDYSCSPIEEISKGSTGNITLYAKWISAKTGLRIEPIAEQPYTGKAIKPIVAVYDGETLLTPGTDYTVSYKNNTKAYTQPWIDPKKAPTVTVKGKGNYNGSDTETFQILPQSIASDATEVVIPDLYLAYNKGKKLSVVPNVIWNGKKLRNNSDFKVTSIIKVGDSSSKNILEEGCKEEGEYTVTVSGINNFSGTRGIKLSVTTKTLMSKVRFNKSKLDDISWDRLGGQTLKEKGINPTTGITLKNGKDNLTEGTHYTVTYDENANAVGTYDVVFSGIGDSYAGTVTKTFKITGTPLTASKLDFGTDWKNSMTYNGTSLEQTLKLSYKKDKNTLIEMKPDEDYTLTYDNVTNVGNKATVVITGKKQYTGVVKKTFKITSYSLETGEQEKRIKITLEKTNVSYEKGGAKPKVTVTYQIPGQTDRTPLIEGKDYTVQYRNNGKIAGAGEKRAPTFTVKGKGNFTGSVSKTFSIEPQDIGKLSITAEDVMAAAPNTQKKETIGLTGKGKYKSTPKITDFNGKALSAGTDFLKTYTFTDENGIVLGPKDQVQEGSILTVTVEGTKNYTGISKVSYRVLAAKKSVAKASVSLKKGVIKEYTLEPVTLKKEDLSVKLNGVPLEKDNFTIISYVDNRKKGTAKVTIRGVGEYGGTKTVNFKISPRKIAWFKTP